MKYDDRYPLKDYLNSINLNKENLMDGEDPTWEKKYPAFIINKCMSHHMDTVLYANEMNMYPNLPNRMQYDFFITYSTTPKEILSLGKEGKGE